MQVFQQDSKIFELLTEGVSEGILVINGNQEIVANNSSAEEIFGYGKDELVGQPLEMLIPGRYRKSHGRDVEGFIQKSEKRKMGHGRDIYGLRKNGQEFPVEAGLNPFQLYGSTYVMALIIDITTRKQMEKEQAHWANIFNNTLNEILIIQTGSLRFLNVNKEAQRNLGYSLAEMRNMTVLDITPKMTEPGLRRLITPLLHGKQEKLKFETIHRRKDGSTYPVEEHLQLSGIVDDEVLVAVILDITDRKNYTEKLEKKVAERTQQLTEALVKEKELNELKTRFLSLVSHEFKTPLSGILTSITLLGKYTQSDQQVKRDKHIATIRNKVKHLDTILNDFLSVEHLDSGKVTYKSENFPLSKVVNEVIYDANMLLKEGQKIQYPDNIDDLIIKFDEKTLELALTNIVYNAIKYSPENSTIGVQVVQHTDELQIKVADQGIGIPAEEQKHIFDRYFRAKNALPTQGTGIGLNIARQHLKNLGASLNFSSEENKGSTFTIHIPREQHSSR